MKFLKSNYKRKVGVTTTPGLYIELKEPQWYLDEYDVDIVQAVYDGLAEHGLETIQKATDAGIPIIIQSFNADALIRFSQISDLPLVQLMHHGFEFPDYPYDLDYVATYAHGVGPDSKTIMWYPSTEQVDFDLESESLFVQESHALNLQVHPYTLRDDDLQWTANAADETALYYTKGVDGIFTEFVSSTFGVFQTLWEQEQQSQQCMQ